MRDVTRQRQAEQRERQLLAEAAAANAKFHAFFEQGALFAGIMDVDGTLLEANRLSLEACGFTREQVDRQAILGRPVVDAIGQHLVEQIERPRAEAAAGQTFRAEMPYFVADGSERIADVTILPIQDETGRVLFLAPTGVDITERKRLEDNLRQARGGSVGGRSPQERIPRDARARAAQSAGADQQRYAAALPVERRRRRRAANAASAMLERQVGQMVRLVDDLLDMSRITRGKIELRKERVELAPIVHQAVEAVAWRCTGA